MDLEQKDISPKEHLSMLIKEIREISKRIQDLEKQAEHMLRKQLH